MNIFHTLIEQMQVMQLPLTAVTLTAVPRADTPLLLMLHWHGFRKQPMAAPSMPGLAMLKPLLQPVPGSALQINDRWRQPEMVEEAVLDAAWQLGAWDVQREEHRACTYIGATDQEALACKQAFGKYDEELENELLVSEAPDRDEMLQLGAKVGYIRWQFRPVNGGVWQSTAEDDTLLEDGRRIPPCPIRPLALKGGKMSTTAFRLGQVNRIILLK